MASVPFPLNVPLAIAQGALGAYQLDKIVSTNFNPPKLPEEHLIDSPQLLLAGEAGPEMVLPSNLTRLFTQMANNNTNNINNTNNQNINVIGGNEYDILIFGRRTGSNITRR